MTRPADNSPRKPRIGLALGSGSARGWSHIGVIRALEEAGIRPDLVCGTSIGAIVGAAYAAGELDRFEQWVRGMRVVDVISFMDVSMSGGAIKGERLMQFLRSHFVDRQIGELAMPFGAVATVLHTGAEVWLREGATLDAVRASFALPGLFTPVMRDGKMLVDGGLVNPVPVSLARAMGADIVVAVDLASDKLGRRLKEEPGHAPPGALVNEWARKLKENLGPLLPARGADDARLPSMVDVLISSIDVMQVRIGRSRLAGDPPDVIVTPRVAQLGLLDFHRASEAIEEGKRALAVALPGIRQLGI